MTTLSDSSVRFCLNGATQTASVADTPRLADVLRERLGLAAAKTACGIGRCGACMVLMNGLPVNACLVLSWRIDGADITTAEGLDRFEEVRLLRQALTEENAFQCGYCASGFVVSLAALFLASPAPDDQQIRAALEGNICRCTGYHSILRGALRARELLAARGKAGPA
jgi:carbon-monoxide dehydrogenase small subunit